MTTARVPYLAVIERSPRDSNPYAIVFVVGAPNLCTFLLKYLRPEVILERMRIGTPLHIIDSLYKQILDETDDFLSIWGEKPRYNGTTASGGRLDDAIVAELVAMDLREEPWHVSTCPITAVDRVMTRLETAYKRMTGATDIIPRHLAIGLKRDLAREYEGFLCARLSAPLLSLSNTTAIVDVSFAIADALNKEFMNDQTRRYDLDPTSLTFLDRHWASLHWTKGWHQDAENLGTFLADKLGNGACQS